MFDGIGRRVVSIWFPRLASDRALRARPVDGPFALTLKQANADRLYCLDTGAERAGLHCGMAYADARAFCPDLQTRPADPAGDARFLRMLRRWATRYCPWVGLEGRDGLVLDITGAAHLFGGEAMLLSDMRQRLVRAGLAARIGLADTRGAAWALAHHGEGRTEPGQPLAALEHLPVAALRLSEEAVTGLTRLGLRRIGELERTARAPLTRRFGPELLLRLDQAMGRQPEQISPLAEPPHYGVRLTLPEPIGLFDDVMAGTGRLLDQLCARLKAQEAGARSLCLTLRRVDQEAQTVELRLARPLRDAARILPLFERGVREVDAGYGIDQMRLEATRVEPQPVRQLSHVSSGRADRLDDLISRIGTRIGLENIQRFLPVDSHIPERGFTIAAAAWSEPGGPWAPPRPRPILLFPPEPLTATGTRPPERFRWRRMSLSTARATGPERIAPEWWLPDENWRGGVRDYWHVETRQGRRLWLFHTPQNPGWFVQGEFA
ncbi:DNA polymerase Y family protein [Ruegeria pomeroyi]|uniref:DNA-directed DNA polymerase n=1 Tax=Ruegeria pomeroyi TaxID=89184 RepID=A0A850LIN1_9RHOB|nr:DNA polymerase Y family protein [Ruegeria pomeroyi]NVK97619.1 DNA polymerase Y family protein [Ruegeria pomeroyi]NVL02825.1 DNA polymerase Y family protein [Ruegeria pomeroyi]QWV07566.1 DNA polymerase Y family protein [Ruegeria pomeroyi]